MCLGMFLGTYFWHDAISSGRQGWLLDGQGLESAHLQLDCFVPATVGKMIHQSWTLQNDCNWNYLHIYWACMKLVCFGVSATILVMCLGLLLVAKTEKVAIFVADLALVLLCGTLESLCVNRIATFIAAVKHLMCLSIVIWFLDFICC